MTRGEIAAVAGSVSGQLSGAFLTRTDEHSAYWSGLVLDAFAKIADLAADAPDEPPTAEIASALDTMLLAWTLLNEAPRNEAHTEAANEAMPGIAQLLTYADRCSTLHRMGAMPVLVDTERITRAQQWLDPTTGLVREGKP